MRGRYNVAIMGATGAVGQIFLELLAERDFPMDELRLLASSRSAGKELTCGQRTVKVQELTRDSFDGIILNAGAYTHTSIAILDALNLSDVPVIEVHLSNIFQREPFRQESFVSRAAEGVICGFGGHGYQLALEAMARLLSAGETA